MEKVFVVVNIDQVITPFQRYAGRIKFGGSNLGYEVSFRSPALDGRASELDYLFVTDPMGEPVSTNMDSSVFAVIANTVGKLAPHAYPTDATALAIQPTQKSEQVMNFLNRVRVYSV